MPAHTDIPTRRQVDDLLRHLAAPSVTIYLSTDRVSRDRSDRIELRNAWDATATQLAGAGADDADVAAMAELVEQLSRDDRFWERQAESLAVFLTPTGVRTFRLPNRLTPSVHVADRFHVTPLLRAVTFPRATWILALSLGRVRLLATSAAGPPEEVEVPGMPADIEEMRLTRADHAREINFVREVDHALRGVVGGSDLPLILAATVDTAASFRSVTSLTNLVEPLLRGNPDEASAQELAEEAQDVLDGLHAAELAELAELLDERSSEGRAATDVADVARLATMGAVDTLLVDMDASLPGTVADDGAVSFAAGDDPGVHDVVDELVRRVHLAGGRILAVRREDVPGGGEVAALLRYAA